LEEPKYSIEQIAVKIGKPRAYFATRLKLTEPAEVVVEEFCREEIGVGHALERPINARTSTRAPRAPAKCHDIVELFLCQNEGV
jgi:hypothetical protein